MHCNKWEVGVKLLVIDLSIKTPPSRWDFLWPHLNNNLLFQLKYDLGHWLLYLNTATYLLACSIANKPRIIH